MHRRIGVLVPTLAALLCCTGVLVAYAVRVARRGRTRLLRLGPSPGTFLFPAWLMEAFSLALYVPARGLARLGVSPDALTYAALAVALASAPLLAAGRFTLGGLVVLGAAALDGLDGMVAREQRRASPAGAVLDSFADRIADAAPLVGLAVFYRERVGTLLVPLAALIASSLVSYARAKADIYGLTLPQGLMRRHERVVYLVGSLLAAPLVGATRLTGPIPSPVGLLGPALIAVLGLAAAILLVFRTRSALGRLSLPPARVRSGAGAGRLLVGGAEPRQPAS